MQDYDGFPARNDDPLVAPLRKKTADGEQRRSCHLSQFLTRQRYANPTFGRSSDSFLQSEQSRGQAIGDSLRRNFPESLFQFMNTVYKYLVEISLKLRIPRKKN